MISEERRRELASRFGETVPPEVDPWRDELRRLATATRALNNVLSKTAAPIDVLTRAAEEVERVLAELSAEPDGRPYFGVAESSLAGGVRSFQEFSPFTGLCNALSPPLDLRYEPDRVVGTGRFGWAFEGPPGCVHGGYVAAAFDEVLGKAQTLSGSPGMTGRLTVRYRYPTPLHEELHFAGWVTDVSGRKVTAVGTLHHGDTLCAEAEGLFISVDAEKFLGLLAARQEAQHDAPPAP